MVAVSEVVVDLVAAQEEDRFQALMQAHHYLGALPGIGETLRYVAHHRGQWLALVVFSAPALKCAARDRWIGRSFAVQFDRLHLLTNHSRFLLLPGAPRNLGSRVLSLCTRRLVHDWSARFAHPLLLVETFVDPQRFLGTVYRAANWVEVGRTRGFARQRRGYSYREHARPKLVFVHPLCRGARAQLRAAHLDPSLRQGVPKMMLTAAQMRSLPEFFQHIDDPRRRQGRRHALATVLALATAATLCGMRGYKAISEWVDDLERHHRRTAERRAAGLCLKCGKRPPAPHRSQCEVCAEKRRPADLERYHRRTAERVAQGLCPKCGKQAPAPDHQFCEPCNEKRNRAGRARDARLRAAGMPRRDRERAAEYERERSRREVEARRVAGLCTKCGQAPAVEGRASCEPCLEKRRAFDRANYAAGKAA